MKKILVVDDIEANRKVLRQMLMLLKEYIVVEAVNGKEAISVFENENPDLILMDVNMPVMNGYESALEIKNRTNYIHTPIIFVTALDTEFTLTNALKSGGDDFVGKPFNVHVLESKIKANLRIRELNQKLNDRNIQLSNEQNLIEHFFDTALNKSYLDKDLIKYHMSPMSTFNGDLLLVEKGPHGGLYLLMGDFTGHGLTAAMGTLPAAMVFFKMVKKGLSVSDISRELNMQLNLLMPTGMFFAATIIEFNFREDIMTIWMGGMPEVYVISNNGGIKNVINSQHMPLGILNDESFDDNVKLINFKKDDKVYFYSDGIIEATNPQGDMFGSNRLKSILETRSIDQFHAILDELNLFTGISSQHDDITLVELTCRDTPDLNVNSALTYTDHDLLPWSFSISVSEVEIRQTDIIHEISEVLSSLPQLSSKKTWLVIILTEMYNNSLEHSLLGLDSSDKKDDENFIRYYENKSIRLKSLQNALMTFEFNIFSENGISIIKMKLSDNGVGFKEIKYGVSKESLYGRGIGIISELSERFEFNDDGTQLTVFYKI